MTKYKITIWGKDNPGSSKEIFVEAESDVHAVQMCSASMVRNQRATFEVIDGSESISKS